MSIATTRKRSESRWQGEEAHALSASIHAGKVRLKSGGKYLHFSALFLTSNRDHAWIGTPEQAEACRRKYEAAAGCWAVEA